MPTLNTVLFLLGFHALLLGAAVYSMRAPEADQEYPPGGCCKCPVNWTIVPRKVFGGVNFKQNGTIAFNIPALIPSSAREVLIYAVIQVDGSESHNAQDLVKIYTQENDDQFGKLLGFAIYTQETRSTNSENMWFPLTKDRRVYVQVFNRYSGSLELTVSVVGYR